MKDITEKIKKTASNWGKGLFLGAALLGSAYMTGCSVSNEQRSENPTEAYELVSRSSVDWSKRGLDSIERVYINSKTPFLGEGFPAAMIIKTNEEEGTGNVIRFYTEKGEIIKPDTGNANCENKVNGYTVAKNLYEEKKNNNAYTLDEGKAESYKNIKVSPNPDKYTELFSKAIEESRKLDNEGKLIGN